MILMGSFSFFYLVSLISIAQKYMHPKADVCLPPSSQIPEVFLNNSLSTNMFFTNKFQNIFSLIVVDEAHMIFLWGLVASKPHKNMAESFTQHEDGTVFCITYRNIGNRVVATNNVPLLLLSATCRPIAAQSITLSLMLQPLDITMLDRDLTRPEIKLIRIPMESTLKSCDDLLRIFAPHSKISAKKTIPTIIYSGTCNLTFQVMKVVNNA
jgi:superfamily II DNA helicase RecQ